MTSLLNPEAHPFNEAAQIVTEYDNWMESIDTTPPRCASPQIRRWTVAEYHRAAEAGIFHPNEHLELIDGEVWRKVSPKNRTHSISVARSASRLEKAFGSECSVERETPLKSINDSEPEPDIIILPGKTEDYLEHPTASDAVLLMEISDSSLRSDRGRKSSLYAASGATEYWILDLKKRTLEVRRDPQETSKAQFGYDYRDAKTYSETDSVTALSAPQSPIMVKDLLPPAGMPVLSAKEPKLQDESDPEAEETTSS